MTQFEAVFVLGSPGSGKGTICEKLEKEFGFHHINVGGIIRKEMKNEKSEDYAIINEFMKLGKIVPVEVTCKLLEHQIQGLVENDSASKVLLLDGFPRDTSNRMGFNKILGKVLKLNFVIYLNCGRKICTERILIRSKTSGRYDDNLESIKERIPSYERDTLPVIDYYRSLGLIREIDAEKNLGCVYTAVRKLFVKD